MDSDDSFDAYIFDALRSTGTVRAAPTRRNLASGTAVRPRLVGAAPPSVARRTPSVVARTPTFDEEDTIPDAFVGNDLSDLDERGVRRSR
jgi:hypothetical protein